MKESEKGSDIYRHLSEKWEKGSDKGGKFWISKSPTGPKSVKLANFIYLCMTFGSWQQGLRDHDRNRKKKIIEIFAKSEKLGWWKGFYVKLIVAGLRFKTLFFDETKICSFIIMILVDNGFIFEAGKGFIFKEISANSLEFSFFSSRAVMKNFGYKKIEKYYSSKMWK